MNTPPISEDHLTALQAELRDITDRRERLERDNRDEATLRKALRRAKQDADARTTSTVEQLRASILDAENDTIESIVSIERVANHYRRLHEHPKTARAARLADNRDLPATINQVAATLNTAGVTHHIPTLKDEPNGTR